MRSYQITEIKMKRELGVKVKLPFCFREEYKLLEKPTKRKNLQLENGNRSWILKSYNGVDTAVKYQSMKFKMEGIAVVEVIMTNNSSLPISVLLLVKPIDIIIRPLS
ncbi:hypothetical protein GCM10007971_37840 [Oceanobacillus indicireducens]|uniref:Uncharacterized protein n=1 Tax=Oceanobacillus indicireducens TaxID=1004261 RepID=A0A917Y4Z0_9BACI|nr:hypothetical protein GCM10007971_37840 [Oceanobacillus indicireducens]